MSINAEVAEGAATLGTHRAFIQWGGFTFGRTSSFVDHEGSLGDSGMRSLYTGLVDSTTGAAGINQIAYTWQLGNGITLNVGADDPRVGSIFNAVAARGNRRFRRHHHGFTSVPIRPPRVMAPRIPIRGLHCGSARLGVAPASLRSATTTRRTYYDYAGLPGYVLPPA